VPVFSRRRLIRVYRERIAAISGTKRRRYVEENVGALEVRLSAEDLAALDAAGQGRGDRYADMSSVDR
jgi:aryl-alcohol dehydrogenase-like predicted oxidoreductase